MKKPFYKRWWFIAIIAIVASYIIVYLDPNAKPITTSEVTQAIAATAAPAPTTAPKTSAPLKTATQAPALRFTLAEGEIGEYGKTVTWDKGTELEREEIIYKIPAGIYIVKNCDAKYPGQISVYSDEIIITSEGWEEPAETFGAYLLQPGETAEIEVKENQYLEAHGYNFEFVQIG